MSNGLENRDGQVAEDLYKTGLVVTSDCCLPTEWVNPSVKVVPLHILFGLESYLDGVDISTQQFYDRLRKDSGPPSTSGPSPGQYLEALHQVEGTTVLILTPNRRLSVTYEAAVLAARLYAEERNVRHVEVLDTGNAGAGFGLAVRLAVESSLAGLSLQQVRQRVIAAMPSITMIGSPATLAYLARGGRIPGIASQLSDRLEMRAVFEFTGGNIHRLGLIRGEEGMIQKLLKFAFNRYRRQGIWLYTFHADAPEIAQRLHQHLLQVLQVERGEICQVSLVVAAHTGPGLVGFAAVPVTILQRTGGK